MFTETIRFLIDIIIGGIREYGKEAIAIILICISGSYLKSFAFRVKDFFTGKQPANSPQHPNRKTVTGSSKLECAQSAYKTAAGYWNEQKDAYSAYVWLSLAVMLGIKDGEAKSFRQTVSKFDDILRKNLSVPQVKAAVEEAQNMFGSVRILPGKPHPKNSSKPANTKRTLQERIAHKLVKAMKSARNHHAFTVMRKILRKSNSKNNPSQSSQTQKEVH